MLFSTIAVKCQKLRKKKKKIGDKKNLFANFIFLKVVASNIHDAFDANHFMP